jgi:DNA-binding Lrp family transcriptional regulator
MDKLIGLDEKDRKILIELDKDSRQADSEIAKKVGLSKQVVNYRIQKLMEGGIINNFYTIVNTGRLGLNSHYVFIQLEKINKEKEKSLVQRLEKLSYVGWLVSGTGRWDLVLSVYAISISNFDESLSEIISICGEHLHEYNFTTLISAEHLKYRFLGETRDISSAKQEEKQKAVVLDKEDVQILKEISQNARENVVKIGELSSLRPHIVSYHLKKLIKEGVIEGFKPKLDINKLGLQWHLLLVQFQSADEIRKKKFIEFCKTHKKIYYVTNTLGEYNLMLDIHVLNSEEFKGVLFDLKENFADLIKTYESIIIFDEYKIDYFPENLISKN